MSVRVLPVSLVAAIALPSAIGWHRHSTFDSTPYLADLRALEDSLAVGYANLAWQLSAGVVDPVALHRRTDSLIKSARSDGDARSALTAFAAAFRDGHLRVVAPPSTFGRLVRAVSGGEGESPPLLTVSPASGCRALGYSTERSRSPLARHSDYRALGRGDASFRSGVVTTNGITVGVIRIGSFGVDRFASLCETLWPSAAAHDSVGYCASACDTRLGRLVSDSLLAELRAAIAITTSAGATRLIVDLTGNGGGTNWTAAAARQFTATPLHGHPVAMIRHPHHQRQFESERAALERVRDERTGTDARWRAAIDSSIARAAELIQQTRTPCDRRAVWTRGAAAITCSQTTTGSFTSGLLEYLPPSEHHRPGAAQLFGPAAFRYVEGVWRGPLFVLVDRNTASASEEFVVLLKDHGAATVIGQRTYGAGCGYTNGGIGFVLPHSGMRVRMPDCARIRRTGQNEVAGVEVDIELPIDASAVLSAVVRR